MPATFRITAEGQAKLERVLANVNESLQRRLPLGVIRLRRLASRRAPSEEVEAQLLSQGQAVGGLFTGTTIGDPEDGRFLRLGGDVSLREAIDTEPVTFLQRGLRTVVGVCSAARINEKTGFSWSTRSRGPQGPTRPFQGQYVQALENGGGVWRVVPRAGTRTLEPETGIFTPAMVKTLPPIGMFRQAVADGRAEVVEDITESVRAAARQASTA